MKKSKNKHSEARDNRTPSFREGTTHGNRHIRPRSITAEEVREWAQDRMQELMPQYEEEMKNVEKKQEDLIKHIRYAEDAEVRKYIDQKGGTCHGRILYLYEKVKEVQTKVLESYTSGRMQMELELGDKLRRPANQALLLPPIIYAETATCSNKFRGSENEKAFIRQRVKESMCYAREAVDLYARTIGGFPREEEEDPIYVTIWAQEDQSRAYFREGSVFVEFYNPQSHESPREWMRIVAHELEHIREFRWWDLFQDRASLTPGEAFLEGRKKKYPERKKFREGVYVYPCDFTEAYMGRDSSEHRGGTEVQSMGVEWLIGPRRIIRNKWKISPDPHDSIPLHDPEYFEFIFKYLIEPYYR